MRRCSFVNAGLARSSSADCSARPSRQRSGLVRSETLVRDFRSFIDVALWRDAKDFHEQVAKYYNDTRPMRPSRCIAEGGGRRKQGLASRPFPHADR
jgi:hypothetical protein